MGTSFEKQLQQLLDGYQEQPPQQCWDSLSSQLEALHQGAAPETGASAQAAGTSISTRALAPASIAVWFI